MAEIEIPDELQTLITEVLKIQEKYGFEMANVQTRRINEIREIIDQIATSEGE
jgi:hypothetical protein